MTIVKNMKSKRIPQRCLNQQFSKAVKPPLTAAITDFVSDAPVICEKAEQIVFDGGSILYLILREKKHIYDKIQNWSTPVTLFQILGVLMLFLVAIQRI